MLSEQHQADREMGPLLCGWFVSLHSQAATVCRMALAGFELSVPPRRNRR